MVQQYQPIVGRGNVMTQRDIHGLWSIIQSNGFACPVVVENFDSQSGAFTLQAMQSGSGAIQGAGNGSVNNDEVHFRINWDGGAKGQYDGTFDAQGVIHGATFDVNNPSSSATWHSNKGF
jgi:hypothetical protein